MAEAGRGGGFLPWERLGLAAVFVVPMLSFQLASATGIQLLPLATAATFLLVLRRAASGATVPIAGEGLADEHARLSFR